MKIKVTIPKDKKKWRVTFGQSRYSRLLPTTTYQLLERKVKHFLASRRREKIEIRVEGDEYGHNETVLSLNPGYLLYAALCFLEDYFTLEFFNSRFKLYLKYNQP